MDLNTLMRLERERADAVIARDVERLRRLAHDDLLYIHATGVRHGKAQWLDYVAQGPTFLAVDVLAPQASVYGDTALLTGELHLQLQRSSDTPPARARSWVSQVWVKGEDGAWRLRLLQSTRQEG
jgi:ketosteroid isomerase-like protein